MWWCYKESYKSIAPLITPTCRQKSCEVVGVFSEQDEEMKHAVCGDNVRLRLKGVEEDEISAGSVLCDPKHAVKTVTSFEAQLIILEHKNIICAGYNAILHVHTCVEEVSVGVCLNEWSVPCAR